MSAPKKNLLTRGFVNVAVCDGDAAWGDSLDPGCRRPTLENSDAVVLLKARRHGGRFSNRNATTSPDFHMTAIQTRTHEFRLA